MKRLSYIPRAGTLLLPFKLVLWASRRLIQPHHTSYTHDWYLMSETDKEKVFVVVQKVPQEGDY